MRIKFINTILINYRTQPLNLSPIDERFTNILPMRSTQTQTFVTGTLVWM